MNENIFRLLHLRMRALTYKAPFNQSKKLKGLFHIMYVAPFLLSSKNVCFYGF